MVRILLSLSSPVLNSERRFRRIREHDDQPDLFGRCRFKRVRGIGQQQGRPDQDPHLPKEKNEPEQIFAWAVPANINERLLAALELISLKAASASEKSNG